MVTPLITKIKSEGGTLYTFTSASKDLTRCYTNGTNYQMKFSKFVCLNLPWIMDGNKTLQKYIVDDRYFEYVKSRIEKESDDNTSHLIVDFRINERTYNRLTKAEVNFLTTEETFEAAEKLPAYEEMDEEGNVTVWHEYTVIFTGELRNEMNINFKIKLYFDGGGNAYESDEFVYHVNMVGNDIEKGLYLEHFPEYYFPEQETITLTPTEKDETSSLYNYAIAEHFQNYILNFETVLLNREGFDNSVLRSPAERVFFNWLEKVGGINFQRSSKKGIDQKDLYVENDVLLEDRTVQYIGNIDIINQVDVNGDTFGEIYMYIPSSAGATTEIYFRDIQDENYRADVYKPRPMNGDEHTDVIQGRGNFYGKHIAPIDPVAIYDGSHPNNYTVDKGFCIDFRDADYEYNSIEQVNANSFTNFEFNTVLIYYDLFDTSTNEEKVATNLYGVLFIDNFVEDNDRVSLNENHLAHIHQYPKFKSSEFGDGNAFALKLDLKIDTAPTTTMSSILGENEVYDNPNDVKGMIMFGEALNQLQKCADTFFTQQNEIYRLQDRVESLESLTTSIDDISTVKVALTALENRFNESGVIGSKNVMDMIENCYGLVSDILDNKYPTKLALDLDKLRLGNGLRYKSNQDGSTTLYNTQQLYNVVGKMSFNYDDINNPNLLTPIENDTIRFELRENTNLVLLSSVESQNSDRTMWNSLTIMIDAYDRVQWEKGQTVKFVVTDDFKFGYVKHNSIVFQTKIDPVENDTHDDATTIIIKEFKKEDLSKMKNKTEIEIVCIDNDFTTDGEKFIIMTR